MGPLRRAFGRPLSIGVPRLLAVLCAAAALLVHPAHAQNAFITVYAAASMKDAVNDINSAFTAKTRTTVTTNYAASSALAKSIENGV